VSRSTRLCSVACAAVLTAAGLSAQQVAPPSAQPTFRADSNLVRVDVVVVDKDGNAVRGLQASDFTILDRKKPRPIAAFVEETHDSASKTDGGSPAPVFPPTLAMDVATNQLPPDDRLVVIVIDDLHLYKNRTNLTKQLAHDVYTKLGPASAVALLFTSGDHDTEVTQQSSEILAAIDTLKGRRNIPRPVLAFDDQRKATDGNPDTTIQNMYDNLQTYKTLEDAAKLLERVPADRKAFVLISEGIGKDLTGVFDGGLGDETPCDALTAVESLQDHIRPSLNPCYHDISLRQMMAPIRRANATVYALDPRGLVPPQQLLHECFGGVGFLRDPCLGDGDLTNPTDISSWVRQAQHGLEITAATTGGIAVTNTNDFAGGITRIVSDIDHYYLLGFAPDIASKGYHDIEIRVDRPGLTVRARS
jgi:VWFA-related protein